ncbi:MAG: hypothetical protein U0271_20760 [Polyangiaceae bacterium]
MNPGGAKRMGGLSPPMNQGGAEKWLVAALAIVALAGCSANGATSTPTASASASASDGSIQSPGFFHSKRFGFDLPLPEGRKWRIDDTTTKWLSATRSEESSTLLVRVWRSEDNRMNRDKCEALARSVKSLPQREGAEIVDTLDLDLPAGFDTRADVALVPDMKGGLFGFVLAFGGYARGCFAYVFATHAEGVKADEIVGDRLALMVEGSLKVLRFQKSTELEGGLELGPADDGKP